ncbi:unnamed protein product [Urochloa humidicola]
MKDLCSLQVTCKFLHTMCKKRHVAQCILGGLALVSKGWVVGEYNRDYHNSLVSRLAQAGNKEACFRDDLCIIFYLNRTERVFPLDMLERATDEGHNLVVYMLAMCLFRRNGDTGDDEKVKELVRELQGEEGPGAVAAGGVGVPP